MSLPPPAKQRVHSVLLSFLFSIQWPRGKKPSKIVGQGMNVVNDPRTDRKRVTLSERKSKERESVRFRAQGQGEDEGRPNVKEGTVNASVCVCAKKARERKVVMQKGGRKGERGD